MTERATAQAVILARGLGSRMRRASSAVPAGALDAAQAAAADSGVKGMIPIGRPFLDYVISALADAGITEVVLVIGPEHDAVREYFTVAAPPTRVAIRFAVQAEPRGTADAVSAAADAVRAAPFLVLNADNFYSANTLRALAVVGDSGLVAFEGDALVAASGIEAERVLRYALVDTDDAGYLRAIVEKPDAAHPLALRAERWVSMNLWSFTPAIFEACGRVHPSPRGELELVDAVAVAMREDGMRFRVVERRDAVLDLSSRTDIATVAAKLAGVAVHT